MPVIAVPRSCVSAGSGQLRGHLSGLTRKPSAAIETEEFDFTIPPPDCATTSSTPPSCGRLSGCRAWCQSSLPPSALSPACQTIIRWPPGPHSAWPTCYPSPSSPRLPRLAPGETTGCSPTTGPARRRSSPRRPPWTRRLISSQLISTGAGLSITSEAVGQWYKRPGVTFVPIRDLPPCSVALAWWPKTPAWSPSWPPSPTKSEQQSPRLDAQRPMPLHAAESRCSWGCLCQRPRLVVDWADG